MYIQLYIHRSSVGGVASQQPPCIASFLRKSVLEIQLPDSMFRI